jgi:hypothetical protein
MKYKANFRSNSQLVPLLQHFALSFATKSPQMRRVEALFAAIEAFYPQLSAPSAGEELSHAAATQAKPGKY